MISDLKATLDELVSYYEVFMLVAGMSAAAYMFYYFRTNELTEGLVLLLSVFYFMIKALFVLAVIIIPAIMGYRLMLSGGLVGETKLFFKKSIVRLIVVAVWTFAFLFVEPDSLLDAGELFYTLF